MRVLLVLGSMVMATMSMSMSMSVSMSSAAVEQIIVFVNGTRMAIQSYEVRSGTVQFTTLEGKLQSVPRSYVNLVATEQANGGRGLAEPARAPAPPPVAREPMPTENQAPVPPIAPPPHQPVPEPVPASPDESNIDHLDNIDRGASPPPVWFNEELQVSLVVPSASWRLEDMPPSFDVAVTLDNHVTEARATLALIRQELRGRKEFHKVVVEIETSIALAPGYKRISAGAIDLDPYQAHEFRFTKNVGLVSVYNRLVVVYSRDLAYVLSLTCPRSRAAENESDFQTLTRGLVIKKSRNDLTF